MNIKYFLFLVSLTVMIAACGSDEDPGTNNPTPTPDPMPDPDPVAMVKLDDAAGLGDVLTDQDGRTLYFFSEDLDGNSACNDGCATNWPPYHLEDLVVGSGLSATDFAVISRTDGTSQTTYKGWPLYYFANDNGAGVANGDGANDIWYAAKPNYTVMVAKGQLVGADGVNYTAQYTEGMESVEYLVDATGRTLYAFINDFAGVNNFTNEDFSNDGVWPIYETNLDEFPSNYQDSDFGLIDVFGRSQLTYKGWPLYYFGQDEGTRGNNRGVSVPRPGVWPIMNRTVEGAAEAPPAESNFDIYTGDVLTFTKADGADPEDEANQDRITENVWLTRGNTGGQIFNAKVENSSDKDDSPTGTEWAVGTTTDLEQLTFAPFRTAIRPSSVVGQDLVLHIIEEDVYIDIKFTSWSMGRAGGFAYERASR